MSNQLTISELIKVLEFYKKHEGDLLCCIEDADTRWLWKLKDEHVKTIFGKKCLVISGDYGDEGFDLV